MPAKALDKLVALDAAARLLAFRDAINRQLPGAVREVVLFGSRARGDANLDSDYDVAVVLAGNISIDRDIRRMLADAAWEHVIDGYAIVPIAVQADELSENSSTRTELGARIAVEGISLG